MYLFQGIFHKVFQQNYIWVFILIPIFFENAKINKLYILPLEFPIYNRDGVTRTYFLFLWAHTPLKLYVMCDWVLASGNFEV